MDSTQIGQAGEYLAAAVLQRHFQTIAFPDRPSAYDLLVETHSNSFLRCQVKTSDSLDTVRGNHYYRFHTRSRSGAYTNKECDFFAFVVLPTRTVVFAKPEDITSAVFRVKQDASTLDTENQTLLTTLGEWLYERL